MVFRVFSIVQLTPNVVLFLPKRALSADPSWLLEAIPGESKFAEKLYLHTNESYKLARAPTNKSDTMGSKMAGFA